MWSKRRSLWLVAASLLLAAATCDTDSKDDGGTSATVATNPTVETTQVVAVDPGDAPAAGTTVYSLYVVEADLDAAFNVVFVPDGSYGDMSDIANRQDFVDDTNLIITDAYWQNQAYFNANAKFNYFYMTESGSVTENPDDADGNFVCPTVTWPLAADGDGAFADQLLLVHSNELRDCGGGGRASAEPTSFRTIVHETGHGIFGLPDEYCCDSSYRVVEPVLYDSEAACTGDPANAAWRNCVMFTSDRDQSEWWRSQGDIVDNLIMLNIGDPVWESGPADWAVMETVYGGLGGTAVVPPSVFAPATWDNPVP